MDDGRWTMDVGRWTLDVGIKCRDAILRVFFFVLDAKYRVSTEIGAQCASNFGNPERFAKEKTKKRREVSRLYRNRRAKRLKLWQS